MFLKTIDNSISFKNNLLKLSQIDIKDMVDSAIFSRGKSYYKDGLVLDLKQEKENEMRARVKGSYAYSYMVKIYKEGNGLKGYCDCPHDGICKHIIAMLLTIKNAKEFSESIVLTHGDRVITHLESFSKRKLINLVMEFAPENFKKEIILKDTPIEEFNIRINEIASSIKLDMSDEELLYSPEKFQEKISEYMENLKVFVNRNPDEVFEIVIDLADEIDAKQEEGYLWIDHYHSEEYFDFDILSTEIMALIEKIEDKKKQIEIFVKFTESSANSSYMSVNYSDLELEDKTPLLAYFDKNSSLKLYHYLAELLSFEEKEKFLLEYESNYIYSDLLDLYKVYSKKERAIDYLEELLAEKFQLEYVQKLLELTDISTQRLRVFILLTIEDRRSGGFDFIYENIKKVEKKEELEKLWEEKRIYDYYIYLEKEQRVEEMYLLLKKLPNKREAFLKKYKERYKKEAIELFQQEIKKNLKTTGNEYYKKIAEYLSHLKPLIEADEFDTMVHNFKSEYKRRRNFVAILEKKFGYLKINIGSER